jgi:hypothetical protein
MPTELHSDAHRMGSWITRTMAFLLAILLWEILISIPCRYALVTFTHLYYDVKFFCPVFSV